jgi:hypothetical protein
LGPPNPHRKAGGEPWHIPRQGETEGKRAHHRETAEVDAKEIGDEEGKDRDESSTKTDENHLGLHPVNGRWTSEGAVGKGNQ